MPFVKFFFQYLTNLYSKTILQYGWHFRLWKFQRIPKHNQTDFFKLPENLQSFELVLNSKYRLDLFAWMLTPTFETQPEILYACLIADFKLTAWFFVQPRKMWSLWLKNVGCKSMSFISLQHIFYFQWLYPWRIRATELKILTLLIVAQVSLTLQHTLLWPKISLISMTSRNR